MHSSKTLKINSGELDGELSKNARASFLGFFSLFYSSDRVTTTFYSKKDDFAE